MNSIISLKYYKYSILRLFLTGELMLRLDIGKNWTLCLLVHTSADWKNSSQTTSVSAHFRPYFSSTAHICPLMDALGPVHTEIGPQALHHCDITPGKLTQWTNSRSKFYLESQMWLYTSNISPNYKQQKYVSVQTKCISDFTSPHLHTQTSRSHTNTVIPEGGVVVASQWKEKAVLRKSGQNCFLYNYYETTWSYEHTAKAVSGACKGPARMRTPKFKFN